MKAFINIEKSAFRGREYVGYSGGLVFRIRKDGCGGWEAWPQSGGLPYLHAKTLAILSDMLVKRARQ